MRFKKSGIITKLVILILVVFCIVTIFRIKAKTEAQLADNKAQEQINTDLEVANAEMEYDIAHYEDEDVIIKHGHEEGLTLPGEKVYEESGG